MNNKINLPFTNKLKGGNKDSFKILNEKEIDNKIRKVNIGNFIKKMIFTNSGKNKINLEKKINYVKGSDTKIYYKKLNKK